MATSNSDSLVGGGSLTGAAAEFNCDSLAGGTVTDPKELVLSVPSKHSLRSLDSYGERRTGPARGHLERFVGGHWFGVFIHTCIVVSAVQMGAQAEIRDQRFDPLWEFCRHTFTAIFGVEMVLKVVALGRSYFGKSLSQPDGWNLLDFSVAWISILDVWILPAYVEIFGDLPGGGSPASLSVFRSFRLLRLLRVLRIMKAIPELRMVVEGILSSLRHMFWVFVLLVIVMYTFSIYCVEVLGKAEAGYPAFSESDMPMENSELLSGFNNYAAFGSIPRAMMSLFGVAILAEYDSVRAVFEVQGVQSMVFVLFIFVTSFGILNVLIGVIVERTTAAMQEQEEAAEMAFQSEQVSKIKDVANVVWELDANHDGMLSAEEMSAKQQDATPHMAGLDFPAGLTLSDVHTMLDHDADGSLGKAEFIDGLQNLITGNEFQKTCLMMLVMGQIKRVSVQLRDMQQDFLRAQFLDLHDEVRTTCDRLLRELRPPAGPGASGATRRSGPVDDSRRKPQPVLRTIPEGSKSLASLQPLEVPLLDTDGLKTDGAPTRSKWATDASPLAPDCGVSRTSCISEPTSRQTNLGAEWC